jgi:hypothetical protein
MRGGQVFLKLQPFVERHGRFCALWRRVVNIWPSHPTAMSQQLALRFTRSHRGCTCWRIGRDVAGPLTITQQAISAGTP